MKQKYAIWGFAGAAFLVTLGITSWRNGLWNSDGPGAQPGGTAVSHSIQKSNPIPKDPFQPARILPAAPAPMQATQSPPQQLPSQPQPQPQPTVENAPTPMEVTPPTAPDTIYEEALDDYKQRAKLMEEIAARARAQAQ